MSTGSSQRAACVNIIPKLERFSVSLFLPTLLHSLLPCSSCFLLARHSVWVCYVLLVLVECPRCTNVSLFHDLLRSYFLVCSAFVCLAVVGRIIIIIYQFVYKCAIILIGIIIIAYNVVVGHFL